MQARSLHEMMEVQKEELAEKAKTILEKDRVIAELRRELEAKKGTCFIFRLSFPFSASSSDNSNICFCS